MVYVEVRKHLLKSWLLRILLIGCDAVCSDGCALPLQKKVLPQFSRSETNCSNFDATTATLPTNNSELAHHEFILGGCLFAPLFDLEEGCSMFVETSVPLS